MFFLLRVISLPGQFQVRRFKIQLNSSIVVFPQFTRRFKRSVFFFFLLFQETQVSKIDFTFAAGNAFPFYSFTLFPSANQFKISIFKRLNFQKYLLSSQIEAYGYESSNLLNTNFLKVHIFSKNQPILTSFIPKQSNFIFSKPVLQLMYPNLKLPGSSRYVRIRRIRFKPGYSRLWREGRSNIKEILEMKIRYQNRLTLRLHQLHRQVSPFCFTYSTVTALFALLGSQMSVDM